MEVSFGSGASGLAGPDSLPTSATVGFRRRPCVSPFQPLYNPSDLHPPHMTVRTIASTRTDRPLLIVHGDGVRDHGVRIVSKVDFDDITGELRVGRAAGGESRFALIRFARGRFARLM